MKPDRGDETLAGFRNRMENNTHTESSKMMKQCDKISTDDAAMVKTFRSYLDNFGVPPSAWNHYEQVLSLADVVRTTPFYFLDRCEYTPNYVLSNGIATYYLLS